MRRPLLPLFALSLLLCACASLRPGIQSAPHELTMEAALVQIESLPVPAGADAAQFEDLRTALHAQLQRSHIAKWTSAAPDDEANKVADLYLAKVDDTTATARWTYRNVGDYDQNSEVNIADLSGLGSNLGKNPASADWAKAKVADGDANGEVNISDLTPLGSHLLNGVDGYSLQMSTTPADEGSWSELALVPLTAATPAVDGPRTFSVDIAASAGQSFRVVPHHGTEAGIPGAAYAYDGVGGLPPLSWEQHDAVMNAIGAKLGDLQGSTSDEQDNELAAFIGQQPGITASGLLGGGGAYGVFSDGRLALALKNREPDYGESQRFIPNAPFMRTTSVASPFSADAELLNCFTHLEPHTTAEMPVAAMLMEKGYNPNLREGSLPEFAQLGALNGPGVLLIDGHGAATPWLGGQFDWEYNYYVSTTTVPTKDLDLQYAPFLWNGTLLDAVVPTAGSPYFERRYLFNGDFIRASGVTLAQDALVFLNTCLGGVSNAGDFREALFEAGAGVVIAWDRSVGDKQANDAVQQFFDDTLGLEDGPAKQDPPQRPFGYDYVLDDMHSRNVSGLVITPKEHAQLQRFHPVGYDSSDGNGQLAPTIHTLTQGDLIEGDDGESMYILGSFGNQPGRVLCNGDEVPVAEWLWNRIRVMLPPSGPGSSGTYLVEAANGIQSNPMELTEWRGSADFEQEFSSHTLSGSVKFTAQLDLHLRGCVASSRWLPGAPPIMSDNGGGGAMWLVSDSSGTYDQSGSLSDPEGNATDTYTPYGSTDLPWDEFMLGDRYLGGSGYLQADGGLSLVLSLKCPINIHHSSNGQDDHLEFNTNDLIYLVDGDDDRMTTTGAPNFQILEGEWTHDDDNGSSILHQHLTITGMNAIYPPNPDAPR
jgi:hypothetical protein